MSRFAVTATQLAAVAAVPVSVPPPVVLSAAPTSSLRGGPAPAPYEDERGPRGHFYYSDGCEDCVYKANQCGCEPAMEYLACATKHCSSSTDSEFAAKCAAVATNCSAELEINCDGAKTSCKSKYNQLPEGGIGLSLDLSVVDDDAYCGSKGACLGTVHMKAYVHNTPGSATAPPPAPAAATTVAAPATPGIPPAIHSFSPLSPVSGNGSLPTATFVDAATTAPVFHVAASAAGPAPAPAGADNGVFLECGMPKVPLPVVDNQTHWTLCRAPVVNGVAGCDLPMVSVLKPSATIEAYCLLTDGTQGNPPKRLTQPAWHAITNVHDNSTVEEKTDSWTSWFTLPSFLR